MVIRFSIINHLDKACEEEYIIQKQNRHPFFSKIIIEKLESHWKLCIQISMADRSNFIW